MIKRPLFKVGVTFSKTGGEGVIRGDFFGGVLGVFHPSWHSPGKDTVGTLRASHQQKKICSVGALCFFVES